MRRRLWLLRGALLAAALVLSCVAWAANRPARYRPPPYQLNGRTSQDFPIWATQAGGSVRRFHALWTAACTRDAVWRWTQVTFGDARYPLRVRGRSFSGSATHDGPRVRGWTSRIGTTVTGKLSSDGRTASGVITGHVLWLHGGRPGATCESGPVLWRLTAP